VNAKSLPGFAGVILSPTNPDLQVTGRAGTAKEFDRVATGEKMLSAVRITISGTR
jgi:hypothetical protein